MKANIIYENFTNKNANYNLAQLFHMHSQDTLKELSDKTRQFEL